MQIPVTNYEITNRDIIETIFGVLFVVFGILGSVIFANTITGLIATKSKNADDRKLNIFILCIHIINILVFVIFIRYLAAQYILNPLILASTFNFIGPTIALSSLYFGQNLKSLIGLTTYITTN